MALADVLQHARHADVRGRNEVATVLAARLRDEDIRTVTALVGTGSPDDQDIALRLLLGVFRHERDRLAPVRAELDRALRDVVGTRYFSALGKLAWHLWWSMDSAAASGFLASLSTGDRSDDELAQMVDDLSLCPGPGPVDKLREIAGSRGPAAARATAALERRGLIAKDALDDLARRWRARKDRASLSRLYDAYIWHLKPGVELAEVIGLLGPPTLRDRGVCIWNTDEPTPIQLVLEAGPDDRVYAWKLK